MPGRYDFPLNEFSIPCMEKCLRLIYACSTKGYYQHQSATCKTCSPGTFSTLRGSSVCEACATNTYQEQSAQSSCLKCSQSSCTNVGGTGKGGYSTCGNATTGACVLCVPGKYLSGLSCKTCASAKFQGKSGMAECETCPPGKGPCLGI